jgi:uncharacterized membrane protein YbhN (UPF0104 family)
MVNVLKKLFDPKVFVSALFSAALLAFILTFTNLRAVSHDIARAVPKALLPSVLLILVYLVAKGIQWNIYLVRLGYQPGLPELLAPYAGGEFSASLPLGVYVESYLFKGIAGAAFGRSAAATMWMLITEILMCLFALLVIGVPGWPWIRPLAGSLIVGMLLMGWFFFKSPFIRAGLARWQPGWPWLRQVLREAKQFLEGGDQLFSWQTFVYGLPLTSIYLGAQATILYIIGDSLIPDFAWTDAAAAYAFALLIVLLVPVLPHLGSLEISGLEVMLQMGISKDLAVGSFLSMRILATGTTMLICGLVLILLRRQVGEALRRLSEGE